MLILCWRFEAGQTFWAGELGEERQAHSHSFQFGPPFWLKGRRDAQARRQKPATKRNGSKRLAFYERAHWQDGQRARSAATKEGRSLPTEFPD